MSRKVFSNLGPKRRTYLCPLCRYSALSYKDFRKHAAEKHGR